MPMVFWKFIFIQYLVQLDLVQNVFSLSYVSFLPNPLLKELGHEVLTMFN
jgi:hypothetical protein